MSKTKDIIDQASSLPIEDRIEIAQTLLREIQHSTTSDVKDNPPPAFNIPAEIITPDSQQSTEATKLDCFKSTLFYPLPHRMLSSIINWFMRIKNKFIKNLQINLFIKKYKINLTEAVKQSCHDYPDFNSFFTRELVADARPINNANNILCSPADGFISQFGKINGGQIFQAKGHCFSTTELLGGKAENSSQFIDGNYITIYLSPSNYHRVHMPIAGTLKQMTHIPGRLFSVAPFTVKTVPRLFARNERLACIFDTEIGPMALILVGAMFVSSMETTWSGVVTPPYATEVTESNYAPPFSIPFLNKGAEMGRFNMGSTVILLFPKDTIRFTEDILADQSIKMGADLAKSI